jgi:hypothetical protein
MSNHEQYERFLATISPLRSLWRSIDIRVLTIKVGGQWKNAMTRCFLRDISVRETRRLRFTVDHPWVRAFQEVWTIDRVKELTGGFESGLVDLHDVPVSYVDEEHNTEQRNPYSVRFNSTRYNREHNFLLPWGAVPSSPWPTFEVSGSGASFHNLLRDLPARENDLDDVLHSYRTPFDGLTGVTEHILGLKPTPRHSERRCQFEIIAPLAARLNSDESHLRGGKLQVAVRMGNEYVQSHLHCGYAAQDNEDELLDAGTFDISSAADEELICRATLTIPSARSAVVVLRVGDHPVDRLKVIDHSRPTSNSRVRAYSSFDSELSLLTNALRPRERSDTSQHERAVERVFALAGFQVLPLGPDKRLSDAMDCLAFDPYSDVLLCIECTTGAIDSGGKLGKLHMRATDLAKRLPNLRVVPVVASGADYETIAAADINQAAQNRIAVLGGEGLIEILKMAEDNSTTPSIADFVLSQVPAAPQSSHLPGINRGPGRLG